ncbi:Decaprenyl-phosphate N-acetylglucosaminephosphotransferase [Streptomyces misionensis JCM 4497]
MRGSAGRRPPVEPELGLREVQRAPGTAVRRRADLADRRPGRQVRDRRPDQARRPDDRRRRHGHAGSDDPVAAHPRRRQRGADPVAGHAADRRARGHHHQRGELRGRPGRSRGRHGVHRGGGVLPVRLPRLGLLRHRGRRPRHAVRGHPDGHVPGLPAAQHASGADLHGRLRVDADRPGAGGRRHLDHGSGGPGRDEPVLRFGARDRPPDGAGLHPAADAADDHRRARRRPGAGDRAPHLAGPVAVRRGPRAPAPPAAGDRPLAQPRGADHVLLVGADRLRGAGVLGELRVDVDRAGCGVPQRGGPGAPAAAALHAAGAGLGAALRAAPVPPPRGHRYGSGGVVGGRGGRGGRDGGGRRGAGERGAGPGHGRGVRRQRSDRYRHPWAFSRSFLRLSR